MYLIYNSNWVMFRSCLFQFFPDMYVVYLHSPITVFSFHDAVTDTEEKLKH